MRIFSIFAVIVFGIAVVAEDCVAQNAEPAPVAKNSANDNPDAKAAFQYLQRQLTIDVSMLGRPESGLARLQAIEGDICRLRCGFHLAIGIHDVADIETEFAVPDMAPSTIRWEIDRDNRAFVSFGSTVGTPVFRSRGRSRKVDLFSFDQKPQSDWSKWGEWKKTEKVACRAKADKADLDRAMRAFSVLASACGARQTPF
jgi:hypothetical protein